MPKQIHLLIAAVLFAVVSTQTNSAEAQHLRSGQPLQAGFRWLGQGWSAGYHHCNPGPNTDYYNPWTAHNSMLISKMPGYQQGHNQYGNAYGQPSHAYSNHSNWGQGHTQSIEPTFVPTDDDSDEDDTDNDFDTGDSTDDDSDVGSDDDADFEDPSFDEDGAFGEEDAFEEFEDGSDFESEAGSSTRASEAGSSSKTNTSGSRTKAIESGSGSKASEAGSKTKASKTGFSRLEPGSFDAMDLNSYMSN